MFFQKPHPLNPCLQHMLGSWLSFPSCLALMTPNSFRISSSFVLARVWEGSGKGKSQ